MQIILKLILDVSKPPSYYPPKIITVFHRKITNNHVILKTRENPMYLFWYTYSKEK